MTTKYYLNSNDEVEKNPINTEGLIEIDNPIKDDGTFYKNHKNLALLELYNGKKMTFYKNTMVDGVYPIDWDKENKESKAQLSKDLEDEIVAELNRVARLYRYDDIKSARASAGVPLVGGESTAEILVYNNALALARWDREVWGKSTEIETEIENGTRTELPSTDKEDPNYIWNLLPSWNEV